MSGSRPVIARSSAMKPQATRRPGITERRLIGFEFSPHQNLVVVDLEAGAEVELHPVPNSESFFVLEGEVEIFGDDWTEVLLPGDCCYFQPGMSHGLRAGSTPSSLLVVFAPGRGGTG